MEGPSPGQLKLLDHLEAVAPVEGHVSLLGRLQVGGQPLGVAVVEDRAHQSGSHPLALALHRRAERGQVPVGLVRVHALDQRQHAHGGPEVGHHVGQHRHHGEEAAQPGQHRLAGRGPDGRSGVAVGRVATAEGHEVRLHLRAEVSPQSGLAPRRVGHQVARHRVVPERLGQLGRHGSHVGRHGAAHRKVSAAAAARIAFDVQHGSLAYHDGVDGGNGPAQAPPGEASAWACPRATRSGTRRSPT